MASRILTLFQAKNQTGPAAKAAEENINRINRAARRSTSSFTQMATSFLGASAALYGLTRGLRALVRLTSEFQSFQQVLRFATGSAREGAEAWEFVRETARVFGRDLTSLTENFGKLAASTLKLGLSMEQTQVLFTGVSAASAALALNSERTRLVFFAISQIASKGTVSMEELRRQLGEHLPGALQISAEAMGVTTQELVKLVETGQLSSKVFLEQLGPALVKAYAKDGVEAAFLLGAEITRTTNAMKEFLVEGGEASGLMGGIQYATVKLGSALGDAADAFKQFNEEQTFFNRAARELTIRGQSVANLATSFTASQIERELERARQRLRYDQVRRREAHRQGNLLEVLGLTFDDVSEAQFAVDLLERALEAARQLEQQAGDTPDPAIPTIVDKLLASVSQRRVDEAAITARLAEGNLELDERIALEEALQRLQGGGRASRLSESERVLQSVKDRATAIADVTAALERENISAAERVALEERLARLTGQREGYVEGLLRVERERQENLQALIDATRDQATFTDEERVFLAMRLTEQLREQDELGNRSLERLQDEINLRLLLGEITAEQARLLLERAERIETGTPEEQAAALREVGREAQAEEFARNLARNFIDGVVAGEGVLQSLFGSVADNFTERLVNNLVDSLSRGLFDSLFGGAGGGGGLLGGLGFFGGGRQRGGPVSAGLGYLVGEGGPELFIPRFDGRILNRQQAGLMGRGGQSPTIVINDTFMGIPDESVITSVRRERRELTKLVQGQLYERRALGRG